MIRGLVLLALLLACRAARAQFNEGPADERGQVVHEAEEAALVREMSDRIKNEPGVADSLAARILQSKVADRITSAADDQARFQDIRRWIDENPQSAAGLGVGLAKDDANGTHSFEDMVTRTIQTRLRENPGAKDGLFGRLKKQGKDSKLLKAQGEGISDEEQREILKSVFEGKGSQSSKIITQQDSGRAGEPGLKSGYYDRLSQSNLRGYSPQLQALQSSLNLGRTPGAPKLVETGKLDYATLSYPGWSIRYDVSMLERRLRYQRAYALAKLLGLERRYTSEELRSPEVEAQLRAKAAGKTLPPRFERRQRALDRAIAAMNDFDAAAQPARDPRNISRSLLVALGAKQREAARWITVASLEEELQRLDEEEGFLSPELIDLIERAPVDPADRSAYRRRGEAFERSLKALKSNDEAAIEALEAADWFSRLDSVENLLAASAALRKDLSRNIQAYKSTAYHFVSSQVERASWRRFLDPYILRLFPSSGYSRRLTRERQRREFFKDVFLKIAAGNLDAAHTMLASAAAGGR